MALDIQRNYIQEEVSTDRGHVCWCSVQGHEVMWVLLLLLLVVGFSKSPHWFLPYKAQRVHYDLGGDNPSMLLPGEAFISPLRLTRTPTDPPHTGLRCKDAHNDPWFKNIPRLLSAARTIVALCLNDPFLFRDALQASRLSLRVLMKQKRDLVPVENSIIAPNTELKQISIASLTDYRQMLVTVESRYLKMDYGERGWLVQDFSSGFEGFWSQREQ